MNTNIYWSVYIWVAKIREEILSATASYFSNAVSNSYDVALALKLVKIIYEQLPEADVMPIGNNFVVVWNTIYYALQFPCERHTTGIGLIHNACCENWAQAARRQPHIPHTLIFFYDHVKMPFFTCICVLFTVALASTSVTGGPQTSTREPYWNMIWLPARWENCWLVCLTLLGLCSSLQNLNRMKVSLCLLLPCICLVCLISDVLKRPIWLKLM